MSIRDAALGYARAGKWVFPARFGTKKSHKAAEYSGGSAWGATREEKEILHNFKRWPKANVGFPTGIKNRFFVVDVDTMEGHGVDGIALMKALQVKHGKLPPTRMAISPSGSEHYYFKYPTDCTIRNTKIVKGIDVQGEGGMVLAPPSFMPARNATTDKPAKPGGFYRWLNRLPIANAPRWLIDLVKAKDTPRAPAGEQGDTEVNVAKVVAALDAATNNNDVDEGLWYKLAAAAWRGSVGHPEAFQAFDRFSQRSSKYNARRTRQRWNSFFRRPPRDIGPATLYAHANATAPGWREAMIEAAFAAIASEYAASTAKGGRGNA